MPVGVPEPQCDGVPLSQALAEGEREMEGEGEVEGEAEEDLAALPLRSALVEAE